MTINKVKSKAAGKNDKFEITYTEFAANQERTEITTGEGKQFDNDALLELLGFQKDANGELKLSAADHRIEKAEDGKIKRFDINRKEDIAQEEEKGA